MNKISSYNRGTIFGVTVNGGTEYYYANGTPIAKSSKVLLTLDKDTLVLGCVRVGDCGDLSAACADKSLLSNMGFCLLTNSGAFITSN